MDKGVSCDHLNKLADVLGAELWKSKEALACLDCGCPGPNLWICLQPDCHHVGCSEVKNDHSTIHQRNYPSHCVHMNVSTERVWCYACEREVHIRAALAHTRTSSDSAAVGGACASRLGFDHTVAMNVTIADEDDDADDTDYGDDDDRPRGLVGLQNMGNTCYMNAALQALSNTAPLTSYFLDCAPIVAVLAGDKKPGLSRAYQKLIKEMWSRKISTRGYVVPNGILYGIRNVHPMFRGYHQHDTQEFLRCFMDQLHEELKEPVYDDASQDQLNTEDGDHTITKNAHIRRRAASSGASDAPLFLRMRRKSPAPSSVSDTRPDGYFRVHSNSESGAAPRAAHRHRRSASFAGTQHAGPAHYTHITNGEKERSRVDIGSESSLSCSSDAEERYETCSSASDSHTPHTKDVPGCGGDGGGARYRSIVSDVFDGKLLSSVQCLICDRVSTRVETFQDLSLPIPSREHLSVLRAQQHALATQVTAPDHDSWLWWVLGWLRSWFYGPVVSLQDCLNAFFSADELKGDNMYSCSRCSKLRNGVKVSRLVRLPEVVCIHLKRFRHELMYSSKLAAAVSFPTAALDLAPYRHPQCTSKISRYALTAVICHSGTAGGGHYTCAALNNRRWYSFDDQCVSPVTHAQLTQHEAYVLFYRKVNPEMDVLRRKAAEIIESTPDDPNEVKYYISKQWIVKFNTWAEPGPIDNSDFVCRHGAVRPERAAHVDVLAAQLAPAAWQFVHTHFGGGPACTRIVECAYCARAAERLRARRDHELTAFYDLHAIFQEQERPRSIYAISMHWFRQWQAFVRSKTREPPPPVDNSGIVTKQEIDGVTSYVLKPGSDHAQLSEELWRFFTEIYGGGPEVRLRGPPSPAPPADHANRPHRPIRKHSESDKEDYCAKSTSETNIRDAASDMAQKNKSLQNIFNRRGRKQTTTESDDDVSYRHVQYKRHEPNGNYQDSDEEMDVSPPHNHTNTIRMENGVDSSDHDANDNPVHHNKKANSNDVELPNLDSISLKAKPKYREHRKSRRRTVK